MFENCKKAAVLRNTLAEMGYPQPATPVQTDNSTACGIANDNIKQQRPRAIDMRFYWVFDGVHEGQFNIYWGPAGTNLADYYTKHHPARHHVDVRSHYLFMGKALTVLRGCVNPPGAPPDVPTPAALTRAESPSRGAHTPADLIRIRRQRIQNIQRLTRAILQTRIQATGDANSERKAVTATTTSS